MAGEDENMYGILAEKPQEKGPVADLGRDEVITLR
jgi:hypothetical protein